MAIVASWATSPLPTLQGSGITIDSTVGIPPLPLNALLATQAAATACATKHTYSGLVNTTAVRTYLTVPSAFASAAHSVVTLFDSAFASQMARLVFAGSGNPGAVRVVDSAGTTLAASANGVIAVNQKLRCELWGDKTNSLVRGVVYAVGSDVPLYDSGNLALAFASQFGACSLHNFTTTPTVGVMRYDSMVATDVYGLVGRDIADAMKAAAIQTHNRVALNRASNY